jgi:hypothetical protein
MMKNPSRNLLMLLKNQFMSQQAIEHEVECLNEILFETESPEHFYTAHELVDRNRITSKPDKILNAIRFTELKSFRFLINKN